MENNTLNFEKLKAKAQKANSPEELVQIAEAEGITLTAEQSERIFTVLNQKGELADDELENVAGGGCHMFGVPENPEDAKLEYGIQYSGREESRYM